MESVSSSDFIRAITSTDSTVPVAGEVPRGLLDAPEGWTWFARRATPTGLLKYRLLRPDGEQVFLWCAEAGERVFPIIEVLRALRRQMIRVDQAADRDAVNTWIKKPPVDRPVILADWNGLEVAADFSKGLVYPLIEPERSRTFDPDVFRLMTSRDRYASINSQLSFVLMGLFDRQLRPSSLNLAVLPAVGGVS